MRRDSQPIFALPRSIVGLLDLDRDALASAAGHFFDGLSRANLNYTF